MRIPSTFFPGIGSKVRLTPRLAPFLPPSFKTYVEPFAGTGSIFLRLWADGHIPNGCTVILNDGDGHITNLFATVRDHAEELAEAVALTPVAQVEYGLVDPNADQIERARQFLARHHFSFNAGESHRKFCVNRSSGAGQVRTWGRVPDRIRALVKPLSHAVITNLDALDCIHKFSGPNTAFVVDPPYSGKEAYYRAQFTAHRDLAVMLCEIDAAGIILTHEIHPDLRDLYPNPRWDRIVIDQPLSSIYRRTNDHFSPETILVRSSKRLAGAVAPCRACGRGMVIQRSDQRFCSNSCRQKAYRSRKSD